MKNQKGYTGVDIAISIVVITMFISIIALLISSFNSSSKELELKSQAIDIAIQEIERIKENGITIDDTQNETDTEILGKPGFYEKIVIKDYAKNDNGTMNENRIARLVKKATVTISYVFKNQEQKVELSALLEKEF